MSRAVFGGTFDPVHRGHEAMAESALGQFDISEIIILPNGTPPHKSDLSVTEFTHRYNMLTLAFKNHPGVSVSDYESNEDAPSYSVYTMRHFRKMYGEDTYFILGADSLLTIHKWRDYRSLLKENRFIVFKRENDEALDRTILRYRRDGVEIHTSKMPKVDVSSTDIRRMLKDGMPCRDIVHPDVLEYICANKLYGGSK